MLSREADGRLPCSQAEPGVGVTNVLLALFLPGKGPFRNHPLPLFQARVTSAAPPPILGLHWKCTVSPFLVCPWLWFLGWNGTKGRDAMGPRGSLHFYKSQINGLWCGIQQSLSSNHTHSHGLHRPSSGPVPRLQTPLMPALQTLWETALVSGIWIYFARPVLHLPKSWWQ